MSKHSFLSHSAAETQALARCLARDIRSGDIICLTGELGTGKTTFVKGLAVGLGIKPETVHSPTFVLLNIYEGRVPVYHFDFYRLGNEQDIHALGYEEFLYGEGLAVVEWSERLGELNPAECLTVNLRHHDGDTRALQITAQGGRYRQLLAGLISARPSGPGKHKVKPAP